jgi:hypothetical protein
MRKDEPVRRAYRPRIGVADAGAVLRRDDPEVDVPWMGGKLGLGRAKETFASHDFFSGAATAPVSLTPPTRNRSTRAIGKSVRAEARCTIATVSVDLSSLPS